MPKKPKKRDPHSQEVIDKAVDFVRNMTPEEALAFLTYKTPGIEESDMTGMLSEDGIARVISPGKPDSD